MPLHVYTFGSHAHTFASHAQTLIRTHTHTQDDVPCYILFKMDSSTKEGWLLANWVPENTKVRQKMLYASTRATLKKELGTAAITAEIIAVVSYFFATYICMHI